MLPPTPHRRAAAAPAFLNVTFYGSAIELAIIRKRLYLALRARPETVAQVRDSADGAQASTMVRLRSDDGDVSSLLGWLSAFCSELRINALHATPGDGMPQVAATRRISASRAAGDAPRLAGPGHRGQFAAEVTS
ncbi:hypothetical protein [Achromobacter aloeverae]|uniref:Uncharacterized protein n=1 Tax=Achromobacter aloeverae TaxID=1750518 RepID=A0A4Q1HI27_9BURK|nr:hypothetical protein [Achromobacter aloeverae]RXN85896.1 hypothetical protein C7R54_19190 [Achromobacter aloeverae]